MPATTEQKPLAAALARRGFTLERFISRQRYVAHGRRPEDCVEWCWVLKRHGKVIDQASTRRAVLSTIALLPKEPHA